ncbi:MAG: phosphoadenosine phosphosulfate reductase [Roseateles sp.]|nr:MAG: phosphoadenosine phosphosulfate reductase [Roseateles sp.]
MKLARQPLVVAYGVGVDSTALLVAMWLRGIRPDLILFSDTKGEKPETYAYLPVINAWLRSIGFPEVTIVTYEPKRAPYNSLEGKCLANETLPSLAFGGHSCSIVFKAGPQHKFIKAWQPAQEAWAAGLKVVKAIGYDNGAQDCRRRAKADRAVAKKEANGDADARHYHYVYPLQDWGIDRVECLRLIASAGLPLPMKSACWFCPASKESEIVWLRDTHPTLFQRALAMEARARDGKHGLGTTQGLGRSFAWSSLAVVNANDVVDDAAEALRP